MPGLIKIQEILHNKVLKLRSVETLITKPVFDRLWCDVLTTDAMKATLEEWILTGNRKSISNWMLNHGSIDLGEHSVRQLHTIAKRHNIKHYSRMSKSELIHAIKSKEEAYEQKQA